MERKKRLKIDLLGVDEQAVHQRHGGAPRLQHRAAYIMYDCGIPSSSSSSTQQSEERRRGGGMSAEGGQY